MSNRIIDWTYVVSKFQNRSSQPMEDSCFRTRSITELMWYKSLLDVIFFMETEPWRASFQEGREIWELRAYKGGGIMEGN